MLKRKLKKFIEKADRWSIGVYIGDLPYKFNAPKKVKNPVLTARDITDRKAEYVADPFMVYEQGTWYMFFEVLEARSRKGDIGLAVSQNGLEWRYEQIVLSEPFHLSYPYVFLWNSAYYMTPESPEPGIRLYKSVEFPYHWSFAATLIRGDLADASVFHYKGGWWLFAANYKEGRAYENSNNSDLHLYYAETPLGPWTEHPQSPVIKGNPHIARPAGRILVLESDKIIRYAQDDYHIYGNKVCAFEITKLSVSEYEEKAISCNPVLAASGRGWNKDGMHTIDPHMLDKDRWIACVDGNARYLRIKQRYSIRGVN
jgi:hypothetical protein